MDSFTLNKIAGAVLGTCLAGVGLGIIGDAIFSPTVPPKPGYVLPEPQAAAAGGSEKKTEEASLPALLAKADATKGEANAKACAACHNFQEGAGPKVGPDLYGVVGRPKGSAAGFDYSAGLKAKGGDWTFEDLNTFITKPSAYIQGTKMGYPGESNAAKRADILVYLRTLSKNPAPLPAVTAAKAPEGAKPAEAGKPTEAAKSAEAANPAAGGDDAILKLIAAADPKKGQANAQVCTACHNLKKDAGALVGPDLWGVVDRPKGSVAGFDYSAGMKAKGGKWTFADLNQFLTKPQAYVQGTKMGYPGEANEKKRAEIIAFLHTLSDNPAPLPGAGDAAPKPAGAPAPAAPAPSAPAAPAPAPPAPPPAPAAPPPPPAPPAPAAPAAPTPPAPPPPAPPPPAPDSGK